MPRVGPLHRQATALAGPGLCHRHRCGDISDLITKLPINVFDLGVVFQRVRGNVPVAFAGVLKRATKAGVIAALVATAALWLGLISYDLFVFKTDHPKEEFLLGGMMRGRSSFCDLSRHIGPSIPCDQSAPDESTIAKFFPKAK